MTATAAEKRVWLRDNGYHIGHRGKLSADQLAAYDDAHDSFDVLTSDVPGDPDLLLGDDYDGGVTEADFPAAPPLPPESKPRKVTPKRGTKADALRARMWGQGKPKPGKKKARPRVPLDRLISRGWQIVARLAAPIDLPVARVLDMQAPIAGVLLEPIIKETIMDTLLQPIARLEHGGEAMFALAGPPLLAGMLHRHPEAHAILVPALEEALTVWVEIAGPAVEAAREKRERWEAGDGEAVKAMLAMIFSGIEGFDPNPPAGDDPADDQVGQAQAFV
jgi:hypothetical protein